MKHGKQRETTTLDENGSTLTVEYNVKDYKTMKPIRKYFEYRERVKDKKEETVEYIKFSDMVADKLDAAFRIEHTKDGDDKGYYYVVKCYTELSYE